MKRRMIFSTAMLALTLIALWPFKETRVSAGVETEKTTPSVVRVTPPAPVFDDARRLAELAARRKQVADTIGPASILVLFSTEPRVYTNDVDYQFRQENNLYYLTNLKQKGATLVLLPGNPQLPEILFLPRRNPAAETWTGHMYSPEEAARLSGIKEIWTAGEFDAVMKAVRNKESYSPKAENILMSMPRSAPGSASSDLGSLFSAIDNKEVSVCLVAAPERGESREYRQEQRF